MRLLFLCHRVPYPPHKGEKIRSWNILKYLAERHEVSLACLADEGLDSQAVPELARYARDILIERIHPRRQLALAVGSLLSATPVTVSYFYSRALQRRLDDLIDQKSIEGLLCSSSPMAAYAFRSRRREQIARMHRVMDLIDVDSQKWQQYAAASSAWTAWLYRREAHYLAAFERRIAREFERVLLVSERERAYLRDAMVADRVSTMPNGVDLDYFSPARIQAVAPGEPTLVFTGVMSYRPNIDGILWFADRILPRVRAAVPAVRLYVVGSRPSRRILRLAMRAGITVTGQVQDVRPYLADASVCIVPLRIARGLQNKVLEAMAMGRAVVTTPEAFEGIDAEPGRDLIVAQGEGEFAAALIELLGNDERRREIGQSARARVESRYTWQRNLQLLDEVLPPSGRRSDGHGPIHQLVGRRDVPLGSAMPRASG